MPFIRQVDHILLKVDDASGLFGQLSGDFALPVAWPPFEYQGFLSAAISFGDVNLELLTPVASTVPDEALLPGTRLVGLAFEPASVEQAVSALDEAGFGHGDPWDFQFAPGGVVVASWTNVNLPPLPGCPITLLVKYHRDQDERRRAFTRALADVGGGPLGVRRLSHVAIALPPAASPEPWHSLLGRPEGERWSFAGGPTVALGRGSSLIIEVRSTKQALAALEECAMLAEASDGSPTLSFGCPSTTEVRLSGPD